MFNLYGISNNEGKKEVKTETSPIEKAKPVKKPDKKEIVFT